MSKISANYHHHGKLNVRTCVIKDAANQLRACMMSESQTLTPTILHLISSPTNSAKSLDLVLDRADNFDTTRESDMNTTQN
jgi:hypothetical protein